MLECMRIAWSGETTVTKKQRRPLDVRRMTGYREIAYLIFRVFSIFCFGCFLNHPIFGEFSASSNFRVFFCRWSARGWRIRCKHGQRTVTEKWRGTEKKGRKKKGYMMSEGFLERHPWQRTFNARRSCTASRRRRTK